PARTHPVAHRFPTGEALSFLQRQSPPLGKSCIVPGLSRHYTGMAIRRQEAQTMSGTTWEAVRQQVRALATLGLTETEDAELCRRFLARGEGAAFEALLRRHGPMVLRVARRVLRSEADAEDVLQATFLLLARKAASVRNHSSLAAWLHAVAHRLALHAR